MTTTWENLAAEKRGRIEDSIPKEWRIQQPLPAGDSTFDYPEKSGILTAEELLITKSSASDLVARLSRGEIKSVDVTVAFCKRAAIAHQLVNGHSLSCVYRSLTLTRSTAVWNSSQMSQLLKQKSLIYTSKLTKSLLVHSMVSLFR